MLTREKWSSEPDLQAAKKSRDRERNKSGNWISRHLSFKRKGKRGGGGGLGEGLGGDLGEKSGKNMNDIQEGARSLSSPILLTTESTPPTSPVPQRRPSCIDGVVPISILPRLSKRFEQAKVDSLSEEDQETPQIMEPPQITQTDMDAVRTFEDVERKAEDTPDAGSDPIPVNTDQPDSRTPVSADS